MLQYFLCRLKYKFSNNFVLRKYMVICSISHALYALLLAYSWAPASSAISA